MTLKQHRVHFVLCPLSFVLCPKQGNKIEGVVLNRVLKLRVLS